MPDRLPIPYELGVLIADLKENRRAAAGAGYGTLEYLIDLAILEAERQGELARELGRELPDDETWKPV